MSEYFVELESTSRIKHTELDKTIEKTNEALLIRIHATETHPHAQASTFQSFQAKPTNRHLDLDEALRTGDLALGKEGAAGSGAVAECNADKEKVLTGMVGLGIHKCTDRWIY